MERVNPDCLFCKIVAGTIPAHKQYENDQLVAFDDIHPQAPIHILIIPKDHIASIDDAEQNDRELLGDLVLAAQGIAREKGIATTGYRLVFNVKDHGGQVVDHVHLHLIGGKQLGSMA